MTPQQIEAYVDASAALLGLELSAEQRPGVQHFFALAKGYADIVDAVQLTPDQESVMTFTPVAPGART